MTLLAEVMSQTPLSIYYYKQSLIKRPLCFQWILSSGCLPHWRFPLPATDCWCQRDGAIPELRFLGRDGQSDSGKPGALINNLMERSVWFVFWKFIANFPTLTGWV